MNTTLKVALLRAGLPQFRVARELGMSETRLSRIVQGRALPSAEEAQRLRELLKCPELFEDTAAGVPAIGTARSTTERQLG